MRWRSSLDRVLIALPRIDICVVVFANYGVSTAQGSDASVGGMPTAISAPEIDNRLDMVERSDPVIGENTFGSTGQPYSLDLGDGMQLVVGARHSWFPDGLPFEGIGIAPDVNLALDRRATARGNDPVLTKAIELEHRTAR